MTATATPLWPHEGAYRASVQTLAAAVFDELDPTLRPRVFTVLLALRPEGGLKASSVEPASVGLPGGFLIDVAERAAQVLAHQSTASRGDGGRPALLDAWRQATQEALGALESASELVTFAGAARLVGPVGVITVVQLGRRAWEAYYTLRRSAEDVRSRRPTSLLESVAGELLRRCAAALTEAAESGAAPALDQDPEEVLATAGRLLADTPALGEGSDLHLRGLFQACNTLAALPYEGRYTVGRLILTRAAHPGLVRRVTLKSPVRLHDIPAVRKLLVTSGSGMALLSDGAVVYGLGDVDRSRSLPAESLFHVSFHRHSTWELSRGLRTLMRVTYGRPRLPRLSISEARFRFYLTRTFGLMGPEQFEPLWGLALAASQQRHGTILVVSAAAKQEAERLAFQGMPVEPVLLDAETLLAVSSIDGAVLVGPDTTCWAIGAILDGRSQGTGDPARGARYNSALRYVLSSEAPCLAVVVSEDGRVDLLCR
jgi:hypothetical protein